MKLFQYLIIVLAATFLFSCDDDESTGNGTLKVYFTNYAGTDHDTGSAMPVGLSEQGATEYPYHSMSAGRFNISSLTYFVSKFQLSGPNGESYEDEILVDTQESKGYYFVNQRQNTSRLIELNDVPAGEYNQITFTLGVGEEGITQGAAGGVLDQETSPFWMWNTGYISMVLEGHAENAVAGTDGRTEAGEIQYHIGGWRDIEGVAANNIRELTYTFDEVLTIGSNYDPSADFAFDVVSWLEAAGVEFSDPAMSSVHAPLAGSAFADQFQDAFVLLHVHQTDTHDLLEDDDHDHGDHDHSHDHD